MQSLTFAYQQVHLDMQTIAEEFGNLSPAQKAKWEDEARKEKVRYAAEKSEHKGPWQLPKRRAKKHPLAPKRP